MGRIRWWIANLWDRLFPRSCWAETACWGMGYEDGKLERDCGGGALPPCYDVEEAEGFDACWCGKFGSRSFLAGLEEREKARAAGERRSG